MNGNLDVDTIASCAVDCIYASLAVVKIMARHLYLRTIQTKINRRFVQYICIQVEISYLVAPYFCS